MSTQVKNPVAKMSEHDECALSWEKLGISELSKQDVQLAAKLKEIGTKIEVLQWKDDIRIKANSWVGHVTFNAFDLVIRPKFAALDASPLVTLLAYAFDWKDLKIAGRQLSPVAYFAEILVCGLLEEARNIQRRGPFQQYKKERRDLSVLRGKIDLTTWLRRGGIPSESMPCVFYRRSLDNILNQTLCAGLRRGAALAKTPELKSKCHFLADTFALSVTERTLDHRMLADAARGLNRLNAHYENAIQIVQLLYNGSGGFSHGKPHAGRIPGFFFDMNPLFERVVAKFLRENLPKDIYSEVKPQDSSSIYTIKSAQKNEQDSEIEDGKEKNVKPSRPDIVITKTNGETLVLDTKYKDIGNDIPTPADRYQLSVYALAYSQPPKPDPKTESDVQFLPRSTILYPASSTTQSRTITLHRHNKRNEKLCTIHLQPIDILELVRWIESGASEEKRRFAVGLIEPSL